MTEYGRRIVVDAPFDVVVAETTRAVRNEGLQVIALFDVRSHLVRALGHDFRNYLLIEAWSPDLAFAALQHDLDFGVVMPTAFGIYELADGETAVIATEPLMPLISNADFRRGQPEVTRIAERETGRVARILTRIQRAAARAAAIALTA